MRCELFRPSLFILGRAGFKTSPLAGPRSGATEGIDLAGGLGFTCHQVDPRRHAFARNDGGAPTTESLRSEADEPSSRGFVAVAQQPRPYFAISLKSTRKTRNVALAQIDRVRQGDSLRACGERVRLACATPAPGTHEGACAHELHCDQSCALWPPHSQYIGR